MAAEPVLSSVFHDAAFLALPVTILLRAALVVGLLTSRDGDFDFDFAFGPVHGGRNQGLTLTLDQTDQSVEFAPMEQQAAIACRIGMHVGGGRSQRCDVAAEQKGIAVLEQHVALPELELARAKRLDFPTFEGNTGLDSLVEVVFEASAFVQGDGGRVRLAHSGL